MDIYQKRKIRAEKKNNDSQKKKFTINEYQLGETDLWKTS